MHSRDVILRPVVSEKSYGLIDNGRYTFVVHKSPNKTQISQAVAVHLRREVAT